MKSVAIIPARGGSKRLPHKNILPLAGRPMLAWSIEAAKASTVFEEVYVSTECEKISEIARRYGAVVLKRESGLGSDTATCAEVCLSHLDEIKGHIGSFEVLYCLYATAPLRKAADLCAIDRMFKTRIDCKSVIATTKYSHNPFQAFSVENDGTIRPFWPELCRRRASDLPILVAGNGSTYAVRLEEFERFRDFYTPDMPGVFSYEMPVTSSIDIDEAEDYQLLQAWYDFLDSQDLKEGDK